MKCLTVLVPAFLMLLAITGACVALLGGQGCDMNIIGGFVFALAILSILMWVSDIAEIKAIQRT